MSPNTQPRVLPGVPTAGRWSATRHTEPSVGLGATFSPDILEQITNRHYSDGAPFIDMTPERLRDIQAHLDTNGDFSHVGVRKAAEASFEAENGYTADEYQRYLSTHGDTSAFHADPDAVRRDIEQRRKEDLADALAA
ncbi:MAG TPA: hypothetical protein VF867_04375 [Arthrobacter sp.]